MSELRKYWLVIAAPIAAAFVFATPPFQAPDEVGHYWHAYAIARGNLLPTIVNGRPSALVPRGVRDIVAALWVATAGRPDLKIGTARILLAARLPLRQLDLVRVTFPAQYTPVPYAAAALACWLGDIFNVAPLVVFYLGRLLNATALILLTHAAVQRAGTGGSAIAAVGILPMTLYLSGSYSPDAITIGVACYVTALVLTPEQKRADWYRLIVAAFVLALCKPVYFLLPLMITATLRDWRKNAWRYAVLGTVIVAGLAVSAATVRRNYFPMREDAITNPTAQLAYVQAHPVHFVGLAVQDYLQHGLRYGDHLVGHLGWLDIQLPTSLVMVTLLLLIAVGLLGPIMSRCTRITGLGIVVASCLLISLSQYVAWTTIGADTIQGMQGRYLLPLMPLTLRTTGTTRASDRARWWSEVLFATAALALNLIGVDLVVHRYY